MTRKTSAAAPTRGPQGSGGVLARRTPTRRATPARLAVIGNVVADVLLHPVTRLPAPGLAAPVDTIALKPGGCAFHTASTARRLGLDVTLFGALGEDAAGHAVRAALAERGLDGPGVQRRAGVATTITVVLADAHGERSFLITEGAAARFRIDATVRRALASASHVHLSGFSLLPGVMGVHGARLLAALRRRGITTSLDTAWRDGIDWRAALDPLLPHLTALMPSLEEAEAATGRHGALACARWFQERGVEHVLITRGAAGALLLDAHGVLEQPAFDVKVVDTTGAGDGFAAGWLTAFLAPTVLSPGQRDPEPARAARLAFAAACGSLACTGLGGEAGPRNLAAVRALLRGKRYR